MQALVKLRAFVDDETRRCLGQDKTANPSSDQMLHERVKHYFALSWLLYRLSDVDNEVVTKSLGDILDTLVVIDLPKASDEANTPGNDWVSGDPIDQRSDASLRSLSDEDHSNLSLRDVAGDSPGVRRGQLRRGIISVIAEVGCPLTVDQIKNGYKCKYNIEVDRSKLARNIGHMLRGKQKQLVVPNNMPRGIYALPVMVDGTGNLKAEIYRKLPPNMR